MLLCDDVKQRCNLNERDIISAATLPELDEAYTRRVNAIFSSTLSDKINLKFKQICNFCKLFCCLGTQF